MRVIGWVGRSFFVRRSRLGCGGWLILATVGGLSYNYGDPWSGIRAMALCWFLAVLIAMIRARLHEAKAAEAQLAAGTNGKNEGDDHATQD